MADGHPYVMMITPKSSVINTLAPDATVLIACLIPDSEGTWHLLTRTTATHAAQTTGEQREIMRTLALPLQGDAPPAAPELPLLPGAGGGS